MDTDTAIDPPTSASRWSFWAALRDPDGYLVLLALTIAQLAIWLLVLERSVIMHVVAYWLLVLTIIAATHRAQVHRIAFRTLTAILVIVATGWTITAFVSGRIEGDATGTMIGYSALVYALLLGATFPLIVRRAFAHRIVTIDTMCAALTAYLFIGLFFSGIIRAIAAFNESFFVQDVPNDTENAVYFAFESLTTLGLGDLTPQPGLPRMITILCALAGQLFLVTAVARTVSLFGEERKGKLVD